VCSAIQVGGQWTTTRGGIATPTVRVSGNEVHVDGIAYAGGGIAVRESWRFAVGTERIDWRITREYLTGGMLDDTCFPGWDFAGMDTWTAGLLDTGGVAWGRYLRKGSSYGAHAGSVTFWNTERKDCLRITTTPGTGTQMASRFSHQPAGVFSFVQSATTRELATKQHLKRFVHGNDLWAPFRVEPGTVQVELTLQAPDFTSVRDRGTFVGLGGSAIGELLDTIGRYGVVDRRIMGGNGWLTGWVCLHEPFFAQMGLALGDPAYTANLAATLDDWRDKAMKPDGRVLSRWHHDTSDNIVPGTYDKTTGYYECGWGYLLDSQPDFVINVAEQFDLSGDLAWLRGQKIACEKALDWLLARDTDGNGLAEMMTDSHTQGKASDWIDVVWASGENALVNAALHEALVLWSEREDILGDRTQATRYRAAAAKLQTTFIRPLAQGGFWNPDQGWFAYWRDRDGSIHGDNLVTPVNFCAIAYGLCDDAQRQRILDGIEARMRQEKLFHWPLCFLSFAQEEVHPKVNWPFPKYENGDIFLSWGEVALRAYARHDPAIAVSYVHKVLDRYRQDGLSFQRYLRGDQKGSGDDILAGNCMTIVGLYRDIYGIRPQWNRLCIDPHMTPELEGTQLHYRLRGRTYDVEPGMKRSAISTAGFTLRCAGSFAMDAAGDQLVCYPGHSRHPALTITRPATGQVVIAVESWPDAGDGACRWSAFTPTLPQPLRYALSGLAPKASYRLVIEGTPVSTSIADDTGNITLDQPGGLTKPRVFHLLPASR
jgi:hypothetical protein